MRFGLFYELQVPRPWDGGAEERVLREALDQVELADTLGFDYLWEVEHHFLEEYSHSSAPEVFLAAASQRTSRIRLGHGIVQLPPPYNHPVRVAERIATLDLLSGGRVDFGTGLSSSQMEMGGFGIERDDRFQMGEEALDAITRMFVEDPFAGYAGRFVKVPPRNVVPKPVQKPHPPLWMACSRRESIVEAAERGMGALSFSFVEPEAAKEWADLYYGTMASGRMRPAGFSVTPSIAVTVPFLCHEDEATAIERGIDGGHFFGFSLAYYFVFGEHEPGRTDLWEEFERHRAEFGFARDIVTAEGGELGMRILEQGLGSMRGAIGTPDQVADLVERYERAGIDQIIFVAQAGKTRHEHICESLELFGKEVLPRFAGEAEEREREKRERLAGAIEEALARKPGPRPAPTGYVVTPREEPTPAQAIRGAEAERPALRERLRESGDAVFRAIVRRMSDRQIERFFGRRRGLRGIFKGMEGRFVPERTLGFRGEVQYEVLKDGRVQPWVVRIGEDRAEAFPGRSGSPAVTIRAELPIFVRAVAGEISGAKATIEGKMQVEGDVTLAARLGEMFGQQSPY